MPGEAKTKSKSYERNPKCKSASADVVQILVVGQARRKRAGYAAGLDVFTVLATVLVTTADYPSTSTKSAKSAENNP